MSFMMVKTTQDIDIAKHGIVLVLYTFMLHQGVIQELGQKYTDFVLSYEALQTVSLSSQGPARWEQYEGRE